jgi:hypothetical protein
MEDSKTTFIQKHLNTPPINKTQILTNLQKNKDKINQLLQSHFTHFEPGVNP